MRGWTGEQLSGLRERYEYGSPKVIAKIIGKSLPAVHGMAQKLGLKNKTKFQRMAKTVSLSSKSISVHFFDIWSSNMAYILGLAFADGWVEYTNGTHVLGFKLRISDREILEKIKIVLKSKHKISDDYSKGNVIKSGKDKGRYIKGGWFSRVSFCSKYMVERIMELGLTPNKSLNENFPPIPPQYLPDFLRGYFDGDGSISWNYNKSGNSLYLSSAFHGSRATLDKVKQMLGRLVVGGCICKERTIFRLHYGKYDTILLLNWFYSTKSHLFLKRKKEKYFQYLEECNNLLAA